MPKFSIVLLLLLITVCSCKRPNSLISKTDPESAPKLLTKEFNFPVEADVYIPIYSDIYCRTRNFKVLLTATLSIRNTSQKDTLYIKEVDYYDSSGNFVRNYLEQPIYLNPMETIDYVIDEDDDTGGSGANFMVTWGASNQLLPIFQAVMLGSVGQQGITFTTEGTTVNEKKANVFTSKMTDSSRSGSKPSK
jgi:hypothetical protein